jgi:hypothetical protein
MGSGRGLSDSSCAAGKSGRGHSERAPDACATRQVADLARQDYVVYNPQSGNTHVGVCVGT